MPREHIGQFYDFLNHSPYGVTEVRIIKPATATSGSRILKIGYFDNKADFVDACARESGGNIYAGVNPCPRKFLGRARNGFMDPGPTTKVSDVEWVTAIMLDIDPSRPTNTAATQAEVDKAINAARGIVNHLEESGICGSESATIVMTGNGCHILIPIPPIEVTDDNRDELGAKLSMFGRGISDEFTDEYVKLDSVFDMQHLTKVIGTRSIKGKDTPERPHRDTYPIDDLERHESEELRRHILNLDVSRRMPDPGTPPPDMDDIPTEILDVPPCDMCEAAKALWDVDEVDDRSQATFVMMEVLVVKGMSREEAIAYIQKYDRKIRQSGTRLDSKYTSRLDGGISAINNIYNGITAGRIPCPWLRENGYCNITAAECNDKDKGGPRYRKVPVPIEEVDRPTIKLTEARDQLEEDIRDIEVRTGPRTHLIVYPSGVGKTHQVAEC